MDWNISEVIGEVFQTEGVEFRFVSQPFNETMPAPPPLPAPLIESFFTKEYPTVRATRFELHSHLGTHIDAPAHFLPDGPTIDQLPLDTFCGEGVVLAIHKSAGIAINAQDLERTLGETPLNPGEILLISTGWASKYGTESYFDHPHLTEDAAIWMANRKIKLLGIDTLTPDVAIPRRQSGFSHVVHEYLLQRRILIVENLGSLARFENQRVKVAFIPLLIHNSDGAPVCAIIGVNKTSEKRQEAIIKK